MHSDRALPPGQTVRPELRVKHYGPVPRRDRNSWWMIFAGTPGAGDTGQRELGRLTVADLDAMPQSTVVADLHCASGWSVRDLQWVGVPARDLLDRFPPPPQTVGVLAYAEYGYCANLRLADLADPRTLLATCLDAEPLTPEHGSPVRLVVPHLYGYKSVKWFRGWEYLSRLRRGFWEERGYHLVGDPWSGRRYSYQE